MFSRLNVLILAAALVSAGVGTLAHLWLQPAQRDATSRRGANTRVERAPRSITLPDVVGKTRALSEWDDKIVLLNFWASWCGPCREEMPLLDRTQQRLASRGLQVVGVAADSVAATTGYLARNPVAYPILVDDPASGSDVSAELGNRRGVLPYTVLIGRDGRVLAQRFGNFTEQSLQKWLAPFL